MKKIITLYLFIISSFSYAQLRNTNWCFGDSAGINFNSGSPIPFTTGMDGRGSCVSISDSLGQLLFFSYTRAGMAGNTGQVKNKNGDLMQNGDSIIGEAWYQEMTTINYPNHHNLYYLFSIGITGSSQFGLYYSIIDMNQNSGLGAVVQKNIQLQSDRAMDGINTIKHANGRDWWLIFRHVQPFNNDYYLYLITPDSIALNSIQSIGDTNYNGSSFIQFNIMGTQIAMASWGGFIELLDFDRCSGELSFNKVIEQNSGPSYPYYFGCEFSPNGRFLYVVSEDYNNTSTDSSHLYQFDLNASDVIASKTNLHTFNLPESPGELKLAPDGKIYLTSNYMNFMSGYPYPDSVRNYVNENLSVINSPDSLGISCDFTPFSFYLGGKRTYIGLPNNPNYDLGPVIASICDTLTAVQNLEIRDSKIVVFPNPFYNKLSFHPIYSSTEKILIKVLNEIGETVFEKETILKDQEVDLRNLTKGVYFLNIRSEKFSLTKKIVKM